jgi:uncharacterized phage protein (TIGR01671 family)
MREIKFRCWDKRRKDWAVCFAIRETGEVYEFQGGYAGWDMEYETDDLVLMQYTGLKDKNGKKIYEGDIVITGEGFMGAVEFVVDNETASADYVINTGTEGESGIEYDGEGFKESLQTPLEVIGNIWGNPELLTPKE